jgi:hypothetical protein
MPNASDTQKSLLRWQFRLYLIVYSRQWSYFLMLCIATSVGMLAGEYASMSQVVLWRLVQVGIRSDIAVVYVAVVYVAYEHYGSISQVVLWRFVQVRVRSDIAVVYVACEHYGRDGNYVVLFLLHNI